MTDFRHGDRIRHVTTGDDGFPVVRYGFIGGMSGGDGPVVVMLDGELGGDIVDAATLQVVDICSVVLILEGSDLLHDPSLRQALVNMWVAEAECAGLQISSMHPVGTGIRDSSEGYTIAEMSSAGEMYRLRACRCPDTPDAVLVHAQLPA